MTTLLFVVVPSMVNFTLLPTLKGRPSKFVVRVFPFKFKVADLLIEIVVFTLMLSISVTVSPELAASMASASVL